MKSLHLATADDAPRILPMVAAFHAERGMDTDDAHQEAAIRPLLEGSPHGAIWLIGPRMAPVGYIVVTFGWSVAFGGLDAVIDEIYVRSAVRGRGMGSDAIEGIAKALREAGVRALHLEVERSDGRLHAFYTRARFHARDTTGIMSRLL